MSSPQISFDDSDYLEQCYAALFKLLVAAPLPTDLKWAETTRLVEIPDQFVPPNQPALVMVEAGIASSEGEGNYQIPKWTFGAIAVAYATAEGSPNPSTYPATVANRIIWAVARAFATTPPYQKQTLGGLVYNCYIDGIILGEVIDQQIVITAPIKIVPGP